MLLPTRKIVIQDCKTEYGNSLCDKSAADMRWMLANIYEARISLLSDTELAYELFALQRNRETPITNKGE